MLPWAGAPQGNSWTEAGARVSTGLNLTGPPVAAVDRLTNPQIAALALYSLGGGVARQHQEDVAVKCYELAPRRFSWERHDYPDIDRAGIALRDGKKAKNGSLVTGDKRIGWLLTPAGIDWVRERTSLAGSMAKGALGLRVTEDRELNQLTQHRLFEDWQAGNRCASIYQVADVLGLPADAPAHSIVRRIAVLEAAVRAGDRHELEEFVSWLKASLSTAKLIATKRSYQQDAENAMGAEPIRAIIELVTNADDAYQESFLHNRRNKKGKIRIELDRRRGGKPTILRVLDRAGGMTRLEMSERLGRLGGRTSGFEGGAERRGLFGRGAKDIVAFGRVYWESKRNGEHTRFEIQNANQTRLDELPPVEPRDMGTTATLEIQPRFRISQHATLLERLKRHYALRPILEDRQGREVTLNGTKVVYEPPRGKLLVDRARLPIKGYGSHECVVTIYESSDFL